jgi:fumarylacetoacetase
MKTWLTISTDSDFSIYNIPFGIFQTSTISKRPATRIGDFVIDLSQLNALGYFKSIKINQKVFEAFTLNELIGLGKETTSALRKCIQELFLEKNSHLTDDILKCLIPVDEVTMCMPVDIPNYTDFYSSKEHATNVGMMFRDPNNALLPNWLHIPVGYHGRASSIVVSGTPIHRPYGQTKTDDADSPTFGPCRLLDFELEMGFIVGKSTMLGDTVKVNEAEDYIFGLVLFNDWSARDIQKWEYVPLGPFLGKNFGSSVSPWIVTLDALEPFRIKTPEQTPAPLPYLICDGERNFDIQLSVEIKPKSSESKIVSKSNFKFMYWNMCQQLAHHTVNGCNIEIGDLYASGTISGPTPDSYGSMLELSWGGKNPIAMPDGTERKFIFDYDTVTIKGFGQNEDIRVGFGEVSTTILPAKNYEV